jgi:hypothetical protein
MGRSYGINNGRDKTNFGNLNGYQLASLSQTVYPSSQLVKAKVKRSPLGE